MKSFPDSNPSNYYCAREIAMKPLITGKANTGESRLAVYFKNMSISNKLSAGFGALLLIIVMLVGFIEVKLNSQAKIRHTGKPMTKTCNNNVNTVSGKPKAGTARSAICINGHVETA